MRTYSTFIWPYPVPQNNDEFQRLGAQITQDFGSRGWSTVGFIQSGRYLLFTFQFEATPESMAANPRLGKGLERGKSDRDLLDGLSAGTPTSLSQGGKTAVAKKIKRRGK